MVRNQIANLPFKHLIKDFKICGKLLRKKKTKQKLMKAQKKKLTSIDSRNRCVGDNHGCPAWSPNRTVGHTCWVADRYNSSGSKTKLFCL